MKLKQVLCLLILAFIFIVLYSIPSVRGQRHRDFLHTRQFPIRKAPAGPQPRTGGGFLDTFSLSFVGNFNFSNIIQGIQKIFEGLARFIDLDLISAAIAAVVDVFVPTRRFLVTTNEVAIDPTSRMDYVPDEVDADKEDEVKKMLKRSITTFVGALLDKQECWEKTVCQIGRKARNFATKDIIFLMAEKIMPSMNETISLMKGGAQNVLDCSQFICRTRIDDDILDDDKQDDDIQDKVDE